MIDEERLIAISNYLNSKDGSGLINDMENLTGSSNDLLLQYMLGGLTPEYLADRVFEAFYDPYTMTGDMPQTQQFFATDGISVVGERLGLTADTVEQTLGQMNNNGLSPEMAYEFLRLAVSEDALASETLQADLQGLKVYLDAIGDAVTKDQQFANDYADGKIAFVDTRTYQEVKPEFDDEGNLSNPDYVQVMSRVAPEDARAELSKVGLDGVFADPDIYRLIQNPADLDRAREAGDERTSVQNEIAQLQSQLVKPQVVNDPEMNQGIIDFFRRSPTAPSVEAGLSASGARVPEGGSVGAQTPERLALLRALNPGATTERGVEAVGGSPPEGTSYDPYNQLYQLTGGRNVTSGYGGADVAPKTGGSPEDLLRRMTGQGLETGSPTSWIDLAGAATPGEPLSTGADNAPVLRLPTPQQEILDRQREAALKAAGRYATFANAEAVAKQNVPVQDQIDTAKIRERALQELQRKNEQASVSNASMMMPDVVDNFLRTVAAPVSAPATVAAKPAKPKLSIDEIQNIAKTIAGTAKRI